MGTSLQVILQSLCWSTTHSVSAVLHSLFLYTLVLTLASRPVFPFLLSLAFSSCFPPLSGPSTLYSARASWARSLRRGLLSPGRFALCSFSCTCLVLFLFASASFLSFSLSDVTACYSILIVQVLCCCAIRLTPFSFFKCLHACQCFVYWAANAEPCQSNWTSKLTLHPQL